MHRSQSVGRVLLICCLLLLCLPAPGPALAGSSAAIQETTPTESPGPCSSSSPGPDPEDGPRVANSCSTHPGLGNFLPRPHSSGPRFQSRTGRNVRMLVLILLHHLAL